MRGPESQGGKCWAGRKPAPKGGWGAEVGRGWGGKGGGAQGAAGGGCSLDTKKEQENRPGF